jgi:low temperature requirement protein LtrA
MTRVTVHGSKVESTWWRPMVGRDRDQPHRAATPLELLFDLCFVVGVAQVAAQLHHSEAEAHFLEALLGYTLVFFGIWWAWVNFTWFASAYDTDDVPYRVLTMLQIGGVLVLAAGVPAAFTSGDYRVAVAGYVIMRLVMVVQWLRAARECPATRRSSLRYALGIALCQIGWVIRLALPAPVGVVTFAALAAAELLVPVWAESSGQPTPWHPGHIAERYGLFTIIVLGECVLAATVSLQAAVAESGVSAALIAIGTGGLLLVCALWWSYFKSSPVEVLRVSRVATFVWGYGHFFLAGSIAALGAGLQVVTEATLHPLPMSEIAAALCVAVPVIVYLVAVAVVHGVTDRRQVSVWPIALVAVLLVAVSLAAIAVPLSLVVLVMGMIVVALVGVYVYRVGYPPS